MNKNEILEKEGWVIECMYPFEIRHFDGSFASGNAAYMVADNVLALVDERTRKGQYVIIDLRNMDFFKDKDDKIIYLDTEDDACCTAGMYEFENAWVMKLIYNHIERE